MAQFTFYFDPSHGWLEVTMDDLRIVGLKPHDFSLCSYRDSNHLYLEEDCDARKFLTAWEQKFSVPVVTEVELRSANNFIRRFPRNTATVGVY